MRHIYPKHVTSSPERVIHVCIVIIKYILGRGQNSLFHRRHAMLQLDYTLLVLLLMTVHRGKKLGKQRKKEASRTA